jgi:hypothetical protein
MRLVSEGKHVVLAGLDIRIRIMPRAAEWVRCTLTFFFAYHRSDTIPPP